jgi:plastocyanin
MRRTAWLVLAASAALAGCGGAYAPTPSPAATDATITSGALEFGTSSLEAPADRPWTMRYVNQSLMPHNVAIYTDATATEPVFVGDTIEQGDTVYAVPALETGTYFFRCDIHPDMKGTLLAGEPVGSD